MSLCIAAGATVKSLAVAAFTLAWTHSIEKTGWQEDWRVTPQGLVLDAARIEGTGAGMEPGPGARIVAGWLEWPVDRPPLPSLALGQSGAAGDWRLCHDGVCRTLSDILGTDGREAFVLKPC